MITTPAERSAFRALDGAFQAVADHPHEPYQHDGLDRAVGFYFWIRGQGATSSAVSLPYRVA